MRALILRRNAFPMQRIVRSVLIGLAMIAAPIAVGAAAGVALGYGWKKGVAAGTLFAVVAGTVRSLLGWSLPGQAAPAPASPPPVEAESA